MTPIINTYTVCTVNVPKHKSCSVVLKTRLLINVQIQSRSLYFLAKLLAKSNEMFLNFQVNYGDGDVSRNDDGPWQDNLSDLNSDFSMPTDDDQVSKFHYKAVQF